MPAVIGGAAVRHTAVAGRTAWISSWYMWSLPKPAPSRSCRGTGQLAFDVRRQGRLRRRAQQVPQRGGELRLATAPPTQREVLPHGQVAAAWQLKELVRGLFRADGVATPARCSS
jgi:hypothetical protein